MAALAIAYVFAVAALACSGVGLANRLATEYKRRAPAKGRFTWLRKAKEEQVTQTRLL